MMRVDADHGQQAGSFAIRERAARDGDACPGRSSPIGVISIITAAISSRASVDELEAAGSRRHHRRNPRKRSAMRGARDTRSFGDQPPCNVRAGARGTSVPSPNAYRPASQLAREHDLPTLRGRP
jgi:hypothetical protein